LVAALLTAYYMTRQVMLVFFGDERWRAAEHGDEHGGATQPHESPWVMTLPLVVLAALAVVGGALNLPFGHRFEILHNFLHPVFGEALVENDSSGALITTLAALAVVASLGALLASRRVWSSSAAHPALEPALLQQAYRADDLVDVLVVRPSHFAADAAATVDTRGIDGAVNGVAALAQASGRRLRPVQTGYVRNYALLIAAGTAATLAWFVFRTMG
jgi:NADH-quinone oxidoreductase subunit L